jgi:hypothetical protein
MAVIFAKNTCYTDLDLFSDIGTNLCPDVRINQILRVEYIAHPVISGSGRGQNLLCQVVTVVVFPTDILSGL